MYMYGDVQITEISPEKQFVLLKTACIYISEESAYRVLTNEGPNNTHIAGVPIILKMYDLHKDNVEVVESVVTLLMELSNYGTYPITEYTLHYRFPIIPRTTFNCFQGLE